MKPNRKPNWDELRVLWYIATHNLVHGRGPFIGELALWYGAASVRPKIEFLKRSGLLRELPKDSRSLRPTLKGYKMAGFALCKECGEPKRLWSGWPDAETEARSLEQLKFRLEETEN